MQIYHIAIIILTLVIGVFQIVRWAEAIWNASRGSKILLITLLICWCAIIAVLTVPASMCEYVSVKGWTNCIGPISATFYNRTMIIAPGLFIVPIMFGIVARAIYYSRAR
jgi:hypothetical protein